jgi:arylsulfatase A-like enzyme
MAPATTRSSLTNGLQIVHRVGLQRVRDLWRQLLLLLLAAAALSPGARPPDVIIITLDTTRRDAIGAYGGPALNSPAIDAFAADAVRFDRAWSTSSWTLPSHASLLTGKFPTSHGAYESETGGDALLSDALPDLQKTETDIRVNRLSDTEVTLAEMLRDRGYVTAAFAGGPWLDARFGLMQGYDRVDTRVMPRGGRTADVLTDRAVRWLGAVPRDRPVHVLINYFDPHSPYSPPPDFIAYARGEKQMPTAGPPYPGPSSSWRYGAYDVKACYAGEVRFMDYHLGRLLGALRVRGRYDSALIVVAADHGELFGEHDLWMHGNYLYEELTRIPLIVHLPGGRDAGTVEPATTSLADVPAFVAREVGFELPAGVASVDRGRREIAYAEVFREPLWIRTLGAKMDRDLWSLVRWPFKTIIGSRGERELYQIDVDPGERNDLAAQQPTALVSDTEQFRRTLAPPHRRELAPVDAPMRDRLRALGYAD